MQSMLRWLSDGELTGWREGLGDTYKTHINGAVGRCSRYNIKPQLSNYNHNLTRFHITHFGQPLLNISPQMKLSITMISILFTSALGASIKRQNDIPDCINGDSSIIDMPGKWLSSH